MIRFDLGSILESMVRFDMTPCKHDPDEVNQPNSSFANTSFANSSYAVKKKARASIKYLLQTTTLKTKPN
jgi:hypothetical protein